jgi:hypothetical protein
MRSPAWPTKRLLTWALALALAAAFTAVAAGDARADGPPLPLSQWHDSEAWDPMVVCGEAGDSLTGTAKEFCGWYESCAGNPDRDGFCDHQIDARFLVLCQIGERWDSACEDVRTELEATCVTSTIPAAESPEHWICSGLFWAFESHYDGRWEEDGCAAMVDRATRPDGLSQDAVDLCRSYGALVACAAASDCEGWSDGFLLQGDDAAAGCTAEYDDLADGVRCRDANEDRWAEMSCASYIADAADPPLAWDPGAEDHAFCQRYGAQRYEDFCPTSPEDAVKPEGIDDFCQRWPGLPAQWHATDGSADENPSGDEEAPADAEEEAEEEEAPQGAPDVLVALGATSPFCNRPDLLSDASRDACDTAGAIAHRYPLAHYGLDIHFTTLDGQDTPHLDLPAIAGSVLQTLGGFIWMLIVYLLKMVLLLLEWAFEVPLIRGCTEGADTSGACVDAMPAVSDALLNLHENVLGTPWMLAAISAAGLWGLWNGLVRMRFAATLAGLAATVLLMALALAIINRPAETVGWAAKLSSDASLGVLNATGRFGADNPTGSFAEAQQGLFDALVTRPWCALQFGDVKWCMEERDGTGASVADVWLAFEPGGVERANLYNLAKGEEVDDGAWGDTKSWFRAAGEFTLGFLQLDECDFDAGECQASDDWEQAEEMAAVQDALKTVIGDTGISEEKVRLQEAGGTLTRLALIGLVGLTQIAAFLVLLWIAIRLATAAVMVLVLLMLAPVWLLAPALGDTGRSAFLTYLKRLATAVAAKLLFALILTVVLLMSDVIATLELAWFPIWLLQLAFWWSLLLKRRTLMAYAGFDLERAAAGSGADGGGSGSRGFGLMQAYFGYRAIRDFGGDLKSVVTAPARAIRRGQDGADRAQQSALRDRFGRQAGDRARAGLGSARNVRAHDLQRRRAGLEGRVEQATDARRAAEQALQPPQHLRDAVSDATSQRNAAAARLRATDRARDLARIDHDAEPGDQRAVERLDFAERDHNDAVTADAAAQQRLQTARDALENHAPDPADVANARQLRTDERNLDQELRSMNGEIHRLNNAPADFSERERSDWIENRRGAIERGADAAADEQLIAAGIDPHHYRSAAPDVQAQMYERSAQAMEEDRRLFNRLDAESLPADVQRREAAAARNDPNYVDDLMRHGEDERAADRQENNRRRNRKRLL